ncbi:MULTISPECIES: O-methyltransferase [unclassified Phenylobacterium]|uniref:O-methyltransferase n=1 Tax=unclassified Phenylobacterium TaxID=2640670 RepID=UPI00083AFAC5|nr:MULTISPECIES: class I SAM-dependent methyltransferase [unclassified Phenylobacterium]
MSVIGDAALKARIETLQAASAAQEAETIGYFIARAQKGDLTWDGLDDDANRFMADKMVALEPIKAEFCHMLCRALRATRVVEVGTSFGVSTLYLADAVRANGGGVVIGTEYEPAKAAQARANFAAAGVSDLIDLREGDLRETLKVIEGPVDFVLMDIWTEMARPALELVAPHLRPGAVIVADNTTQFREAYRHFFAFVEDPRNGLKTMTLPFDNGLELVVKV